MWNKLLVNWITIAPKIIKVALNDKAQKVGKKKVKSKAKGKADVSSANALEEASKSNVEQVETTPDDAEKVIDLQLEVTRLDVDFGDSAAILNTYQANLESRENLHHYVKIFTNRFFHY